MSRTNDLLLRRRVMMGHKKNEDLGTYLRFDITSPGDINWGSGDWENEQGITIEYSKNGGPWTSITSTYETPATISVVAGDSVRFRGDNSTYCVPWVETEGMPIYLGSFYRSTCGFTLAGNIMSLISSTNFENLNTLTGSTTFARMFQDCAGLTSASQLSLPATTLTEWCYYWLFSGCSLLTSPPSSLPATTLQKGCYCHMFDWCSALESTVTLPATTMVESCYASMFYNCSSLENADLPQLNGTILAKRCYSSMFYGCSSLTAIPANYLPVTTLAEGCYADMFNECSSLVSVPTLPALTMAKDCYAFMFKQCAITSAPSLPATTLAQGCYKDMFSGCTNLASAPTLSVLNLEPDCYNGMFSGCTSLVVAPVLPATTLAVGCYESMFRGCTELVSAPELNAAILVSYCYQQMFYGCTKLNYIKCLATTINSSLNTTHNWLTNVSSSGTFVKDSSISTSTWGRGNDGIPQNWTVTDAS